jgi:hypothetical protein
MKSTGDDDMAQKRMFSMKIVDTDLFLDMPITARLLYYDLNMRADDDGFVGSPKKIQRMIGCSDDDMKLLIAKQFIIPFDNGVCVIKHWRIHNYIQKDRYNETLYLDEKSTLEESNGTYEIATSQGMDTECIQNVSKLETQVRLGKDRLELVKSKAKKEDVEKTKYADYVSMTNKEYEKLIEQYGEPMTKRMIEILDNYKGSSGKKYKSDYRTILNWVVERVKKEGLKQESSNYIYD